MAGSVWERKDGRFGAEHRRRMPDGTVRTRTTTKRTRAEAEAWLSNMQAEDPEPLDSTERLEDYLHGWLRDAVEPARSRRTWEKRSWAVRVHIAPSLGKTRLSDLAPRAIQSLYASLSREGYAYSTRREIHVTLNMALSQAVRWSLLRRNPVEMVDAPRDTGGGLEDEIRALTDSQAVRFFASTQDCRWRNYYVAAVRTGLRPGEMLGLRWGDLDLAGDPGSLRVRRTLDAHRGAVFNPPKGGRPRTVALHHEAKGALLSQREMLRGEELPASGRDLVFPSSTGSPMKSDNLRKRNLKPDLKAAGLPELTLHELRHTFASIMLHEWHVAPAVVSEAMGHKDIAFTFRVYGHLIESAQGDVMRRLNARQKRSEEAC